ncbi:MAG: HRDC domain-containing protein [Propionibacteriaceae bacterium]|nr:HRDC domain-containing protein [Propionibacteriaceae bacterium]
MTAELPTTLLTAPSAGVPGVTRTVAQLAAATERLLAASGPLAIDTERAHGFRYAPKAYLIQLRRGPGQAVLLDPIAFEPDAKSRADFSELAAGLSQTQWIIHAAAQDMPALAEVQLLPKRLFDTELAGRLLNYPLVNLNAMTESLLGVSLLKEHSAADWSTRPLPPEWLNYAALDVELLADLRDCLRAELEGAGKLDWAEQEFAHLVKHGADPPSKRPDPWRRTSGLHNVRTPRGMAVVRSLWEAREQLAAATDIAPGRILRDAAITDMAMRFDDGSPAINANLLRSMGYFRKTAARQYEAVWLAALREAAALSPKELPPRASKPTGIPHPRNWERRSPASYDRWQRVRPAVVAKAEEVQVPVENLLSPDAMRNVLWEAPAAIDASGLDALLAGQQVRQWQRELIVPVMLAAW